MKKYLLSYLVLFMKFLSYFTKKTCACYGICELIFCWMTCFRRSFVNKIYLTQNKKKLMQNRHLRRFIFEVFKAPPSKTQVHRLRFPKESLQKDSRDVTPPPCPCPFEAQE